VDNEDCIRRLGVHDLCLRQKEYPMRRDRRNSPRILSVLILSIVALMFSTGSVLADKKPKTYPQEGKIIGTGINQVGASRTYKVVTDTKTYELDCGKHPPLFSKTPGECGGDKKLQIGDTLHFRTEKGRAYIAVPAEVEPSGEQQLRILREELKPNAKPADNSQAAQPQKSDAKPDTEKQ
jgi:hypothetical protein